MKHTVLQQLNSKALRPTIARGTGTHPGALRRGLGLNWVPNKNMISSVGSTIVHNMLKFVRLSMNIFYILTENISKKTLTRII